MSDIIYKMGNTHYAFDQHNIQKNKEGDIKVKENNIESGLKKAQNDRSDFISDINITYHSVPSNIETYFTGDADIVQAINMSTNTISLVRKLDLSQQSYFNISQYSYYHLAMDMIRNYLLSPMNINRAQDNVLSIPDVAKSLNLIHDVEANISEVTNFISANSTAHNCTLLTHNAYFNQIEKESLVFDKNNKLTLLPHGHKVYSLLKKEEDGIKNGDDIITALLFDPKSIYANVKDIKIEYINNDDGKVMQQMILNLNVMYTKNIFAVFTPDNILSPRE